MSRPHTALHPSKERHTSLAGVPLSRCFNGPLEKPVARRPNPSYFGMFGFPLISLVGSGQQVIDSE